MKTYVITSPEGQRAWSADDVDHAREQHVLAFPEEPVLYAHLLTDPSGGFRWDRDTGQWVPLCTECKADLMRALAGHWVCAQWSDHKDGLRLVHVIWPEDWPDYAEPDGGVE